MTEQKSQTENLKKSGIWKPNFKRSIYKKIAAAVSAALVVTCISLPSAADIPTASAEAGDKISLAMEYMGSGTAPKATGEPSASLKETGEIWLGVSAVSTEDGLKMDDGDLALFTKGVYSFEMSFAYDSDYIEPHGDASSWENEIKTQNLSTNSESSWSSDYEIIAVSDTDINKDASQTMPLVGTGTNWRMCTVNIRYTGEDIANARFYGMSDDGTKQYLLKMPFDVTDVPSSGTEEVIQPVLGPETFDIGSGMYGADYEGEWLNADTGTEYTNLKNVFEPSGNILLFTDGATISNIDVKKVKYTPNAEDPETNDESFDESAVMYHDETQDGAYEFRVEKKEYYVSVENEVDKVRILITAGAAVTVNSSQAQAYVGDGGNYYADISLETLDADSLSASDGYNVVNVNGEYTLHIRRLLKPRIEFKPGNSPYGLIERMSEANGGSWDADKVQAAKDAFKNSETKYGNLTFNLVDAQYVPDNAEKGVTYTTAAWRSYNEDPQDIKINYDLDEVALFVYTKDAYFKDPGVTIYDEEGNPVNAENVEKELKVGIMKIDTPTYGYTGASGYIADETDEQTLNEKTDSDVTGFFLTKDQKNSIGTAKLKIRPDVYFIEYTYTAENDVRYTFEDKRPVIVLTERGDLTFTDLPVVNTGDVSIFSNQWATFERRNSLYAFRIADLAITDQAVINTGDVSMMKNSWAKGFTRHYNEDVLK